MPRKSGSPSVAYTVPGVETNDAENIISLLQDRLNALNDLALTLKHVHWNVVGPHFIAVHTMLDPQVDAVRLMVDATAERIATLGGSPSARPERSSRNAAGMTTRSGAPTPSRTSAPWTSSTKGSSRPTATPSTRPTTPTRSPRTCSSPSRLNSNSSTGSSALTSKTQTGRFRPAKPRPNNPRRRRPPLNQQPATIGRREVQTDATRRPLSCARTDASPGSNDERPS